MVFLFRGASEGKIRRQLVEMNLLDAVIGLPANLFYGTGIPCLYPGIQEEPDMPGCAVHRRLWGREL